MRANSCQATGQSAAGLHWALGLEGKSHRLYGVSTGDLVETGGIAGHQRLTLQGTEVAHPFPGPLWDLCCHGDWSLFKCCSFLTSQSSLQAPGRARLQTGCRGDKVYCIENVEIPFTCCLRLFQKLMLNHKGDRKGVRSFL